MPFIAYPPSQMAPSKVRNPRIDAVKQEYSPYFFFFDCYNSLYSPRGTHSSPPTAWSLTQPTPSTKTCASRRITVAQTLLTCTSITVRLVLLLLANFEGTRRLIHRRARLLCLWHTGPDRLNALFCTRKSRQEGLGHRHDAA